MEKFEVAVVVVVAVCRTRIEVSTGGSAFFAARSVAVVDYTNIRLVVAVRLEFG